MSRMVDCSPSHARTRRRPRANAGLTRPQSSARGGFRRLLRRSGRHLDLDRDAGRWVEAEDVSGCVVARNSGDAAIEMRDVEGRAGPPEGIRLLAVREERLWSCRPRFDRPALDLHGDVDGAGAATAAEGVEAPSAFDVTPGLGPICRAVELGPGPEAAEIGAEVGIVAIERNADLPHVVVGTTAVRRGRRCGPDHQGRRDDQRCHYQPYPSHRPLPSPLRPWAGGASSARSLRVRRIKKADAGAPQPRLSATLPGTVDRTRESSLARLGCPGRTPDRRSRQEESLSKESVLDSRPGPAHSAGGSKPRGLGRGRGAQKRFRAPNSCSNRVSTAAHASFARSMVSGAGRLRSSRTVSALSSVHSEDGASSRSKALVNCSNSATYDAGSMVKAAPLSSAIRARRAAYLRMNAYSVSETAASASERVRTSRVRTTHTPPAATGATGHGSRLTANIVALPHRRTAAVRHVRNRHELNAISQETQIMMTATMATDAPTSCFRFLRCPLRQGWPESGQRLRLAFGSWVHLVGRGDVVCRR